jgi:CCR4-NOT transcription complex subunit 6
MRSTLARLGAHSHPPAPPRPAHAQIQSDHFDDFFAPELARAGYAAVYKRKTEQVYTGSAYAIDGCATFFRKDAFALIKKYEVEFNKAAGSLAEGVGPPGAREKAMSRLMKNNVALILVLEALEGTAPPGAAGGAGGAAKRQLLCVANTHIHANPELNDVKLWQVHTLLKGLEKIAASAEIPMVVCGDFNSVPGSAAHCLLSSGRVDPSHPELGTDPLGILRPAAKLCHGLPLASAYAAASRPPPGGDASLPDGAAAERLRSRLDVPGTGEPRFTNCTRDFVGTLDYIFFTRDSLAPTALLELPEEGALRGPRGTGGLPSAVSSSDHVALMSAFAWAPRR